MLVREITAGWKMHTMGQENWQGAVVPGTVYTDLNRNGKIKDPYWKDNAQELLSLMELDYEYETEFECDSELLKYDRILLRFEGIDTLADIYLNDCLIGSAFNMHRTWEYSVKDVIRPGKNKLTVRLHSPLEHIRKKFAESPVKGAQDAMDGFVHIRKAHYMFGWDWGAHLPDQGIFRKVFLTADNGYRLREVRIHQNHKQGNVDLNLEVLAEGTGAEYRVLLTDPQGERKWYEGSPKNISIEHPQLW